MNRLLLPSLAVLVSLSFVRADEALNKLMSGHEQATRAAILPLHRKLLTDLQKLETQYTKSGQKIPLAETQAEIARVKQWVTVASQPAGKGGGPQPGDFKILYPCAGVFVMGSWENGELKPLPKGFAWTNKAAPAEITHSTILTGAFEAEITWKGTIYMLCLNEADYQKYVQFYCAGPADNERHTLKVKRTAAGVISSELDGKPVQFQPQNGARPDMYMRFNFRVLTDATVEFQDITIKDLSVKK